MLKMNAAPTAQLHLQSTLRQTQRKPSCYSRHSMAFHWIRFSRMKQDRQCRYDGNNKARSRNHCSCGKAISVIYSECQGFVGLGVACWPLVLKFAGSNPAEAKKKIHSTPSFGGGVKPSVPCRRFAACKRSIMARIETPCRQNYLTTFLAHSSTFRC